MSAEFNWWLLIVGIVAGGALTWLVLADSTRHERDIDERELPAEADWIARSLAQPGVDAAIAESVLRAHRQYRAFPPPDALVNPGEVAIGDSLAEGESEPRPPADPSGDLPETEREPPEINPPD
jgi:hypothetical protein